MRTLQMWRAQLRTVLTGRNTIRRHFNVRFDVGSLGLHLEEAKSLLGWVQRTMVAAQLAKVVARTSVCPRCGAQLACKGHHLG